MLHLFHLANLDNFFHFYARLIKRKLFRGKIRISKRNNIKSQRANVKNLLECFHGEYECLVGLSPIPLSIRVMQRWNYSENIIIFGELHL